MTTAILLVDEAPSEERSLRSLLATDGYQVIEAASVVQVLSFLAKQPTRAIVLDLPSVTALALIAAVRERHDLPIVIVSQCESELAQVAALDAGANAYVIKPFRPAEFLARLRATLRRAAIRAQSVEIGPLKVQLDERRASVDGQELELTPIEFDLLEVMARRVGMIVTHRRLLREVWGNASTRDTESVRALVCRLRRKLEPNPGSPRLLHTAASIGYKLKAPDQGRALAPTADSRC